jgi:RimJ/RimL family protein N-acetyltransferase
LSESDHLAQWARRERLQDGSTVLIRPLRPDDAELYPDFLADVTAEDLRLRFFAPVKELSPQLIRKLTDVDFDRVIAFAAFDEASGKLLGVVRLHRDHAGDGGEYAVLVRSNLKGHGLGWALMQRMIEYARAAGMRRIHGEVLSENTFMLQMCAELGFHIEDDPEERGTKRVTLELAAPPA